MKYLQDYMNSGQDALFKEQKVFFAFNDEQVNEGMTKHSIPKEEKIVSLGSGMVCPKANARSVLQALDGIYRLGIEQDIKENGIDKIILRELYNHECFYVGDITDCVNKLEDYPITKNQIINIYRKNYDI